MPALRKPDFEALKLYTTLRDVGAEPKAVLPADGKKVISVEAILDDRRCLVHFDFAVSGELLRMWVERL